MHFILSVSLIALIASVHGANSPGQSNHNADSLKPRDCPSSPGVICDCTYYYCSVSGDTCASIATDWGITVAQFETYNPAVGSDCSKFQIGVNYCVEENDGNGPGACVSSTSSSKTSTQSTKTTSTSKTSSTTSKTSSTSSVPSPIQSGTPSNCNKYYDVQSGDTCSAIASDYGITLTQFYGWNPAVGSSCQSLDLGYYVCVGVTGSTTATSTTKTSTTASGPSPTQSGIADSCDAYYDVVSGDTCQGIVTKYGNFTLSQFYSWNPAVGSSCTSLDVGYYVCIGVKGATSTTSKTSTTTSKSTSTGPSPTQSGIISSCTKYYKAVSGDTCQSIVTSFGEFTLAQFESWNPAVGSSCNQLIAGDYYCVAIPGTPTTRTTSTTTSSKTTSTSYEPRQSGVVSDCKTFYDVASGDTCVSIESKFSITSEQFLSWNTGINAQCSNLLLGYYCCVGV